MSVSFAIDAGVIFAPMRMTFAANKVKNLFTLVCIMSQIEAGDFQKMT
jgi:hypothetical protein